jgi:hypothetical protein
MVAKAAMTAKAEVIFMIGIVYKRSQVEELCRGKKMTDGVQKEEVDCWTLNDSLMFYTDAVIRSASSWRLQKSCDVRVHQRGQMFSAKHGLR